MPKHKVRGYLRKIPHSSKKVRVKPHLAKKPKR